MKKQAKKKLKAKREKLTSKNPKENTLEEKKLTLTKKAITKNNRINYAKEMVKQFSSNIANIKINEDFSKAIDSIKKCKGKIITTGMGKAGIIMRKFSSTLCSFGIPSCYLHPGESSHGDLGLISKKDILFVASTSGKTREIVEIIELARGLHVQEIIGVTSHKDSPIRNYADKIIDMGIVQETGYLNIAPTSSTIIMLVLSDIISLILAKEKKLTLKEYGMYHHSGYLGEKARKETG